MPLIVGMRGWHASSGLCDNSSCSISVCVCECVCWGIIWHKVFAFLVPAGKVLKASTCSTVSRGPAGCPTQRHAAKACSWQVPVNVNRST